MATVDKKTIETNSDEPVIEVEALDSVELANKQAGELLGGEGQTVGSPFKKKGETQAEYIERVPIGNQPAAEGQKRSYLGKLL